MATSEELVDSWLTMDEVAQQLSVPKSKVRRMIEDSYVVGIKRGKPLTFMIPAEFFAADGPVSALRGTITTLADAGFSAEETIVWLFTPDETLPGRAIDLLRVGNKAEVRRRAQALAF